jgi:hypothetical protein
MAWVKLDDQMPEHPKVEDLSDRAFRVYIEGIAYCSRTLSDGRIPASKVKKLGGTPKVVQELVEARLWHANGVGFMVNDYLKYNPSKATVEKRRTDSARRLREWRETRKETDGETE